MPESSKRTRILVWGWTLSLFLLFTYLICVGFGLLAPDAFQMHEAWAKFLPGFEWLTWPGFLAGAVGSFLYGWFIALLVVPLYDFMSRLFGREAG